MSKKLSIFTCFVYCLLLLTGATTLYAQDSNSDSIYIRFTKEEEINLYKQQKAFSYANDSSYWKKTVHKQPAFFNSPESIRIVEIVLYCILGVVLIFAIVRIIMHANISLFHRPAGKLNSKPEFSGMEAVDLEKSIYDAVQQHKYREATRFLFLKSLTLMGEQKILKVNQKFTNIAYLNQMKNHSLESSFKRLVQVYEYVWYGAFQLDKQQYDRVSNYFDEFNNNLKA